MSDKKPVQFEEGAGRIRVRLSVQSIGNDLMVRLYNDRQHIGAVALSEYHPGEKRASTSVLTRFGHRDDTVACKAAHDICRRLKIPVCVLAGIHVDNITKDEIKQIVKNCDVLVERFLATIIS